MFIRVKSWFSKRLVRDVNITEGSFTQSTASYKILSNMIGIHPPPYRIDGIKFYHQLAKDRNEKGVLVASLVLSVDFLGFLVNVWPTDDF